MVYKLNKNLIKQASNKNIMKPKRGSAARVAILKQHEQRE